MLQGSQTITASQPATADFGTKFTVTASTSSALPVTIVGSGACSSIGTEITMTSGTGTCTVTFTQAGDANYSAAPQVSGTTAAQPASQTISFGALAGKTYGDAPFAVGATASSNLEVSFRSDITGTCTVGGSTVTIVAAGSCTIRASQGGDADYAAASEVAQSFTISQASQSISFGALGDKHFGDPDFTVSATGGASGQPVTFTAAGSCTVDGNLVHIAGVGSCTVTAHQAGTTNYGAAADVPQSLTITDKHLAGDGGDQRARQPDEKHQRDVHVLGV